MADAKTLNISPGMNPVQIAQAYSDHFNLPFVILNNINIAKEVFNYLPIDVIKSYKIIPYEFDRDKQILKLAVADPNKLKEKAPKEILDLKYKKINISLSVAASDDFEEVFNKYHQVPTKVSDKVEEGKTANKDDSNKSQSKYPTIQLVGKKIANEVINKFPEEVAEKYHMVVFEASEAENTIKVAAMDPEDESTTEILDFVKNRNHLKIELFKANKEDIEYALKLYQEKSYEESDNLANVKPQVPYNSQTDNVAANNSGDDSPKVYIPLAKPIANINEMHKKLPPLNIQNKSYDSSKPALEVKSNEINQVGNDEPSFTPISEEDENNLDKLFSSGIGNDERLTNVIKSGIIPKIVAATVFYAVELESSDIHFEATATDFRLRYRIDGMLRDIIKMPKELHAPVISRIKILAKLKIDEQRIPQDGRFDVIARKKEIDLRVSTFPTVHGEKVVLRILDKSGGVKKLEDLGFNGTNLKKVNANIIKPYGIILATGPTGSGKSTTLYAILNKISKPEVNIITLEDPVEYDIPGINQSQIKPKIGFSFAEGLRSILRQDPDIIMVGEIRDTETAAMSTHAALTGHLVLSTLHTNDASGALPRLINMGIEPFLITSSINCIIAQRLVRKVCDNCKTEYAPPEPVIKEIKDELSNSKNQEVLDYLNKPLKFYKGKGCHICSKGYKGRIGIYEVLEVTAEVENLAVHKEPASKIQTQAIAEGMISIKQDGIIKALNGFTTLDEVMRVTMTD